MGKLTRGEGGKSRKRAPVKCCSKRFSISRWVSGSSSGRAGKREMNAIWKSINKNSIFIQVLDEEMVVGKLQRKPRSSVAHENGKSFFDAM